ncbi:MAG: glycosyltransferase [Planctomycetes bacterium]|nr:glycosyltransferase [Planctomycetota bacterium]
MRRENVSLIHAHQCGPLFYSALARLPSRRIPILFTEHGRDYPDYRRWKRVYANRLLLTRRDRFVAVGECVRKALVEYEGLPTERIQVFYNGRDLSDYQPDRPLRSQVRDELGLSPDSFVVMQVARLNRLKDYPTALRSMARLAGQAANAVLVIVGDGEDRQEIERLIAELRLQQVVRLLGSRNDVPRLLQAADAFLLTSVTEGIPLTVIEAMATALPCVATRVGGMPEVIAEGETGFLAEAGDDGELARQLARLSADPAARERMGRAGRKRALACFDAAAMHRSYRKLYHELI